MVSLQEKNKTKIDDTSQRRKLSEEDLIEIVERASTLFERLDSNFAADPTKSDAETIDRRLNRWRDVIARGDREAFNKRLSWDNLDLDRVKAALGEVKLVDRERIPRWAKTIAAALDLPVEIGDVKSPAESQRELIPFEELYRPLIMLANQRLQNFAGASYNLLSEDCHQTLELNLLAQLSGLCSRAMELEFKAFRAYRQQVSASWKTGCFGQFPGSQAQELYRAFVTEMQEGKIIDFFQEYSVLARLVGTLVDFWVDAIAEFLLRLDADWQEIERTFESKLPLDRVVEIKPFLSDRHHDGRTVMAIQFASDLKVIYKPKDIGQEVAYFQLLEWLNCHDSPLSFKVFKTLNRSTHGWVEYVEQLPCNSPEEAERYYQRAGMLLCLLYVLEGTDVHHENIVACGEHPVLIDMETLFHHRVKEIDSLGDSALDLANEQMLNSVMRTYFLPRWEFGRDGQGYDISGLGAFGGQETSLKVPQWKNVNTDAMKLTYEKFVTQPSNNVPLLDGEPVPAKLHIEDLVAGFREMYGFWMTNQTALLASDSPLGRLAPQKVRFIFRHTKIYASIIRKTINPQYLKRGVDRSIEIEVLGMAMLNSAKQPVFWQMLQVELASVEQLDIPMFVSTSDSNSLRLNSESEIADCFMQPSYDLVISRIKELSESDLETQVSYIWGSMHATAVVGNRDITENILSPTVDLSDSLRDIAPVANLTPQELVEQSKQIARELAEKAIYTSEGSATWISLIYQTEIEQYEMLPMGFRLFDGGMGVALFLAGLSKITGEDSHRQLALATISPLLGKIAKLCDRLTQEMGIGGGMGAGALIYSLVRCGQLLEEDFLEPVNKVAQTITTERINNDRKYDILAGSAGTILGLLALYEVQPTAEILQQAIACGRHLLDRRVASKSGHRAWVTGKQTMLTGFSHGAAGIAYALSRLFAVTQQEEFLAAALESNAYETSVFLPEKNNWPDFRYPATKNGYSCWNSWCHGAVGIGMARVAELDILPDAQILRDIEIAIETTKKQPLERIDQLCCGNLGRVEFLLNAARKLNRAELQEFALQRTSQVVNRALTKGKFGLNWETGPYDPSFFQGSTGIGYQLLRMAHPDLLPSILIWE